MNTEKTNKEAIILLNMGGPNNLSEVEVFLENMFNDPNILTMKSGALTMDQLSLLSGCSLKPEKGE